MAAVSGIMALSPLALIPVLIAFSPLLLLFCLIQRNQFDFMKFIGDTNMPCGICCHSIIAAGVISKLVGMGILGASIVSLVIQNPIFFNLLGLFVFVIVFDAFATNTQLICDTGRANCVLQLIVSSLFNILIFMYFASQILPIFPNTVQIVAGVTLWNLVQLIFNIWLFWRIISRRQRDRR